MSKKSDARVRPWIFLFVLILAGGLLAAPAWAQTSDPCTVDPTLSECSTTSSSTDSGSTTDGGGTTDDGSGDPPPDDGDVDPDDGDILNQPLRSDGWLGDLEAWLRSILSARPGLLDRR